MSDARVRGSKFITSGAVKNINKITIKSSIFIEQQKTLNDNLKHQFLYCINCLHVEEPLMIWGHQFHKLHTRFIHSHTQPPIHNPPYITLYNIPPLFLGLARCRDFCYPLTLAIHKKLKIQKYISNCTNEFRSSNHLLDFFALDKLSWEAKVNQFHLMTIHVE